MKKASHSKNELSNNVGGLTLIEGVWVGMTYTRDRSELLFWSTRDRFQACLLL